jgi:hypothetical protein
VRVTFKGKPAVRFKDQAGKTMVAPLTGKGDRCRVASPLWNGNYVDADGQPQRVPLCENKVVAEQMLADLVLKAGQGKAGIRARYEPHRKRLLLCVRCDSTGLRLGLVPNCQPGRSGLPRRKRLASWGVASISFQTAVSRNRLEAKW